MKKVAIGIDDWKLPIFKRHLNGAGYKFTKHPFTADTLILKVETARISDLQKVVEAAQLECKTHGR